MKTAVCNAFYDIYDRLTQSGRALNELPLKQILTRTHYHPAVHEAVALATRVPPVEVREQLISREFIREVVRWYADCRLYSHIILNEGEEAEAILSTADPEWIGSSPWEECVRLTILHDSSTVLPLLHLPASVTHRDQMYLHRAEGCLRIWDGPEGELSTLRAAVEGGWPEVVERLVDRVTPTREIWKLALTGGHPRICQHLLPWRLGLPDELAEDEWNLIYSTGDLDLVYAVTGNQPTKRIPPRTTYYSAVLSGNVRLASLFQTYYPDLHHDLQMDAGRTGTGRDSLLLADSTYSLPGRSEIRRFGHVVNYAVQSLSLFMVQYVLSKGYGITTSNILTAYRQSTWPILRHLLSVIPSERRLPSVLWLAWGPTSYTSEAEKKIALLAPRLRTDISRSIDYQKKLSVYRTVCTSETCLDDPLWLLNIADMLPRHTPSLAVGWAIYRALASPTGLRGEVGRELLDMADSLWGTGGSVSPVNRKTFIKWGREDVVQYDPSDQTLWAAAGLRKGPSVLFSRNRKKIHQQLKANPDCLATLNEQVLLPLCMHLYSLGEQVWRELVLPASVREKVEQSIQQYEQLP